MDKAKVFLMNIPEDEDSVVYGSNKGLDVLNDAFDKLDDKLTLFTPTAPLPVAVGKWNLAAGAALASSAVLADNAYTWTQAFNLAGRGSFTQSGSFFQITTAGYYRIGYCIQFTDGTVPTEGYISAGIKQTGVASFVTRCYKQSPVETYGGITSVSKSVIVKADAASADIITGTNYQLAAIQETTAAASLTPDISNTWFTIEYIRGL